MPPERRFLGAMSEDYRLVRLGIPDFEKIQSAVAEVVRVQHSSDPTGPLRVLDIGCGDGITSATILACRQDLHVTAMDSEAAMLEQARENLTDFVRQGRCQVILSDALSYLGGLPASAFDVVASALALHNQAHDYRHELHREIFRVLRPGGWFVNADKVARSDEQRLRRLQLTLERFFDALVPLGKLDLLRECVLHEIGDEFPERVMREDDTVHELGVVGFQPTEIRSRFTLATVLVAEKPI